MVSKQFYQDIDMVNIGQLIGARHQNVNNADMTAMVTLLGSNNKGLVVWNTDQNKEFVWDGTSFIPHETIQNASTTQAGVVQLNDNINSTSTTEAATANAVKKAYDIGNNKLPLTGGTLTGVLNGTSAVFSSSVQVGNGIHSASAVSFLNGGAAQNINTGGVLASNAYADATKVPTNGIYSKGKVHTATAVEIGSSVDGAKDTDYVRAVIHPPTHTGGDWEHTVRDDATYAYYKLGYGTSGYLQLRSDGVLIASGGFSGNATTATQLETARTINGTSFNGTANITTANWGTARTLSFTGDVTGSASVNGSANVATAMTLANSGVTAGTYKSVTVDAKGRVTAGTAVVTGLVTATAASGTANTATTNTNTFLNIVETVGATPSTVGTSTQITGAGTVTVTSDTAGKLTITGAQNITGNAATATKLATARTINGVSFNGTANITVADSTKVPLAGGTMTGNLTLNDNVQVRLGSSADCIMYHNGTHTYIDQNVTGDLYVRNNRTGGTIFLQADSTGGVLQNVLQAGVGADNACVLFAAGADKLTTTAAGVSVTGTITATGNITAFSDARLKDNITKIPDALNKLNQLKGVTYTRKDLASDKQYAGLIAQDVQKVLPEAVAVTEDDIIAVDYNGVIGLLVEAIKELENRIAVLECK